MPGRAGGPARTAVTRGQSRAAPSASEVDHAAPTCAISKTSLTKGALHMVAKRARRAIVVLAFGVLLAALSFLPGRVSKSASYKGHPAGTSLMAHGAVHERGQEGDAESEAYADRAYPGTEITIDEIQGAIRANDNVAKKAAKLASKWD